MGRLCTGAFAGIQPRERLFPLNLSFIDFIEQ